MMRTVNPTNPKPRVQAGSSAHPKQNGTGLIYSVAKTQEEVRSAWSLVYRAYRRIGIIDSNPIGIHAPPHTQTNDLVVIRGMLGNQCVSTISSILDDSEHGLPLDDVYSEELISLRKKGHKLIEVGLFADRRKEFDRSIYSLLDLMRWATYFGESHNATQAVIGVHPHHTKFYKKILGFESIGDTKSYRAVNDAPVQLLTLNWQKEVNSNNQKRGITYFVNNPLHKAQYKQRCKTLATHFFESNAA